MKLYKKDARPSQVTLGRATRVIVADATGGNAQGHSSPALVDEHLWPND